MTDLLDNLHADAGLNLLRADAMLTVYDGVVPNPFPGYPYVLVYTHLEWPKGADGVALDNRSIQCTVLWYCHCVGTTAASARAVSQRVRAALLNQRPTIAGRVCGFIYQEDSNPPQKDESTSTVVMDARAVYSLVTLPG